MTLSSQNSIKAENLVIRTYRMGVRFNGSKETRRLLEIEANSRIARLQTEQEDFIFDDKAREIALSIVNQKLDIPPKFAPREIQKSTKRYSNISDSAYYWLYLSSKSTAIREERVKEMFSLFKIWEYQAVEWMLFGRSPRVEKRLYLDWQVRRLFTINLLHSTRRKFDKVCPKELKLSSKLPTISRKELERSIKRCSTSITKEIVSSQQQITDKSFAFMDKLHLLEQNSKITASLLHKWIIEVTSSRWKSLKNCANSLSEVLGKPKGSLFSAMRTIVAFALYPIIGQTVSKVISQVLPEEIVPKPFERKRKGKLPIILLMKKNYVVVRPGNSAEMTNLARIHGRFQIGFTQQGKKRINGTLIFPKRVQTMLKQGAKIKVLQIRSGCAPNYKLNVSVTLEGNPWVFFGLSNVKSLSEKIKCPSNLVIGIDINRLGKYTVALSNEVPLPKIILKLINRYHLLTRKIIPDLNRSLKSSGRRNDNLSYTKLKGELSRVYRRRCNILKEIKHQITCFIAATIVKSNCKVLCIEDLEFNPIGLKGALAKIFYSFPDEINIYKKATSLASYFLGYKVQLIPVNPSNTSKYHYNCGGRIERTNRFYDNAKCEKCNEMVNTHINAARNIKDKGIKKLSELQSLSAYEGNDFSLQASQLTSSND